MILPRMTGLIIQITQSDHFFYFHIDKIKILRGRERAERVCSELLTVYCRRRRRDSPALPVQVGIRFRPELRRSARGRSVRRENVWRTIVRGSSTADVNSPPPPPPSLVVGCFRGRVSERGAALEKRRDAAVAGVWTVDYVYYVFAKRNQHQGLEPKCIKR